MKFPAHRANTCLPRASSAPQETNTASLARQGHTRHELQRNLSTATTHTYTYRVSGAVFLCKPCEVRQLAALSNSKMSSSESFAGEADGGRPARLALPGPRVVEYGMKVYLVVRCAAGMHIAYAGAIPAATWAEHGSEYLLVGFLLGCAWALATTDTPARDDGHRFARAQAVRTTKAEAIYGFVEYPVKACAMLLNPIGINLGARPAQSWADELGSEEVIARIVAPGGENTRSRLRDLLSQWMGAKVTWGMELVAAPAAAYGLVTGAWSSIKSVVVTKRINRALLLDRSSPNRKRLAHFMQGASAALAGHERGNMLAKPDIAHTTPWASVLYSAELVLEWLEATMHIKDIKKIGAATTAFARVFARSSKSSVHELTKNLVCVPAEVLRRARVRLDCLAMLLFRKLWAQMCQDNMAGLSVYLFTDASPQWRGLEMYASTVDIFDGANIMRKMLPMVSLERDFMDTVGKTFAILWQSFLMVGPTVGMMRAWCSRVRAVTTDQGVERFIVNCKDILDLFYQVVDPAYPKAKITVEEWLFPRALTIPGWMHMWDIVIRRGLCQLRTFPSWVEGLKAIVSFLRKSQNKSIVLRQWKAKGLSGAAELLEQARLPHFAEWRWRTLEDCCREVNKFIGPLRTHFDPAPFRSGRETTILERVEKALRSDAWRQMLGFVYWFTSWFGRLMAWGQGCPCHHQELQQGMAVECSWKGRRLHQAHAQATSELRRGLDEANSWTAATWGLGYEAWLELQGCVRAAFHLGSRKVAYLDKVPYLLARLGEPGVRGRCLEQWSACPPEAHHRVTREFLDPRGALRRWVDGMAADGTMHPNLLREVQSLRAIPMDDTVAESPHAKAHRLMRKSPASTWPWVASSMRLEQNLQDVKDLPAVIAECSLEHKWRNFSALVKGPSSRRQNQSKRLPAAVVRGYVYNMTFAHEQTGEAPGMVPILDGDEGGDVGAGANPGQGDGGEIADGAEEGAAMSEGEGLARARRRLKRSRAGGREAEVVAEGGVVMDPRYMRKNTEEVKLMRQFLAASLEDLCYISAPAVLEEGDMAEQFFQVLACRTQGVFVQTFKSVEDDSDGLFNISVQPLETWRAPPGCPGAQPNRSQEVFVLQDPTMVDVLDVFGGTESRHLWVRWTPTESDLHGSVSLTNPCVLRPTGSLGADNAPVLCLCDALRSLGWEAHAADIVHTQGAEHRYDSRRLSSKRRYLQCVLALPDLFAGGVVELRSNQSSAYYELVLKTKAPVELGLSAQEYKRRMALAQHGRAGAHGALLDLETPAAPAPAAPLADRPVVALPDEDGHSSIAGDDDVAEQPDVAVGAVAGGDILAPIEDPADDIVGDEEGAPLPLPLAGEFPEQVLGQRLLHVQGRAGGGWKYNNRLNVKCSNLAHQHCSKSRSVALETEVYGYMAPVFYLGAWLSRCDLSEADHRKFKPSETDIRNFASEYQP